MPGRSDEAAKGRRPPWRGSLAATSPGGCGRVVENASEEGGDDGVYVKDAAGRLRFHETPPVTTLDVAEVLAAIESRIGRLLARLDAGTGAH